MQAADQLVHQLVARDVLRGVGLELLVVLIVARLGVLVHDARLRPEALDPLNHQPVLPRVLHERLRVIRAEARPANTLHTFESARLVACQANHHRTTVTGHHSFGILVHANLRWIYWRIALQLLCSEEVSPMHSDSRWRILEQTCCIHLERAVVQFFRTLRLQCLPQEICNRLLSPLERGRETPLPRIFQLSLLVE